MEDLVSTLLIFLEDEVSSSEEDESNNSEQPEMFKKRDTKAQNFNLPSFAS